MKSFSVNISIFLAILLLFSGCFGLGKGRQLRKPLESYKIYTNTGQETDIEAIVQTAAGADVLFIGETHNDPVAHDMEIKLLKALHKKMSVSSKSSLNKDKRKIVLSLEFFEKDVQTSLDEYLRGWISEKHFRASARAWPNYMTDYRPLIEYAKENKIEVIAANAPRRYVNMVSRMGRAALEPLSDTAKSWLPPLPYEKASEPYIAKLDQLNKSMLAKMKKDKNFGKSMKKKARKKRNDPAVMKKKSSKSPFVDHNAQSLWDASMAWSVANALNKSPEKNPFVINISGSFHCGNMLGIPEHLLKYRPSTKIVVVTIKPVEKMPENLSAKKRNDTFIIYSVEKK